MKRALPWAMVWVRAALGPVMLLGARRWPGPWLAGLVVFALLDDIFDGILARRWRCDTPRLRLADSWADTVFYLGVACALWLRSPETLRRNGWLLAALFGLEGLRYALDFARFRKAASYHSYLAKVWGLVIAAATVGAFAFSGGRVLVRTAILLGLAVNLEGLGMSLMLPRWQNDVKTLLVALQMRQRMLRENAQ